MAKLKKEKHTRFNQALIDRIDSIKSDGDYNPYKVTKKRTVSDQELFQDELYHDYDEDGNIIDEEKESSGTVLAVIVILMGVIVLGAIIYGILQLT